MKMTVYENVILCRTVDDRFFFDSLYFAYPRLAELCFRACKRITEFLHSFIHFGYSSDRRK